MEAALVRAGRSVIATREPGGSPDAEAIRRLLIEGQANRWDAVGETLLFYAARRDHVTKVIAPALDLGTWVVCDRFADSTVAYQGYGRGLDLELIRTLDRLVTDQMRPDLTILLDIDAAAGLARARGRNSLGGLESEARFENEDLSFHERVRQGYLELAKGEPARFRIVDASLQPEAVQKKLRQIVDGLLGME